MRETLKAGLARMQEIGGAQVGDRTMVDALAPALEALEMTGGKVSGKQGAAELLGIKPTTLASRMNSLGIEKPR